MDTEGINSLLVEGGGHIFGSYIKEQFFDELYWFTAAKILGDAGRASVAGLTITKMKDAVELQHVSKKMFPPADMLNVFTPLPSPMQGRQGRSQVCECA